MDWTTSVANETLGGQVAGLALMFLTILLFPVFGRRALGSTIGFSLAYISIIVRAGLCLLAFLGTFNPPVADSYWFQREAVAIYSGSLPFSLELAASGNWPAMHSILFLPFGPSLLLPYAAGLIAFSASILALGRLIELVGGTRWRSVIIGLFCLLPGHLLIMNYNYRETVQVLFLILTVCEIIRFRRDRKIRFAALAAFYGYLFACTHGRYLMVLPLILGVGLLLPSWFGQKARSWQRVVTAPVAALAVLGVVQLNSGTRFAAIIQEDGIVGYATATASNIRMIQARTAFPITVVGDSSAQVLAKFPALIAQYTAAPLWPWLVKAPMDLIPAVDTIVRLVFLVGAIGILLSPKYPPSQREMALLGVAIYAAFSIASMLGTFNVGTQMRHQLKIDWLLLVAAAPVLGGRGGRSSSRRLAAGPERPPR